MNDSWLFFNNSSSEFSLPRSSRKRWRALAAQAPARSIFKRAHNRRLDSCKGSCSDLLTVTWCRDSWTLHVKKMFGSPSYTNVTFSSVSCRYCSNCYFPVYLDEAVVLDANWSTSPIARIQTPFQGNICLPKQSQVVKSKGHPLLKGTAKLQ